jgi:DtxR family Mn-dependent transcriptional regulator
VTRVGARGVFLNATETYLRAILECEEERGGPSPRTWLRERLGIGRASIDQYVHRLNREGKVDLLNDHRVRLTEPGRRTAARVMRKHRLAERMLVEVIGLDWAMAHAEASRWQHVLGDDVERRLVGILNGPWVSPYGNPIPALDELLPVAPPSVRPPSVGSDDLARRGGGTARLQELSEGVQADGELLTRLRRAGLLPGSRISVGAAGGGCVTIGSVPSGRGGSRAGGPVRVEPLVAGGILVVPTPADRSPSDLP